MGPLELPSSFWKPLVGASLTDADLEAFDINAHESLNVIATLRAEEFSHTIFESFTVMRSDKTVVELCEGGAERQVTAENRKEYLSLARTARLHESSNQIEAIRRGITRTVPAQLLSLFTWQELRRAVCGEVEVDVALLRRHTQYAKPLSARHPLAHMFWRVVSGFTADERRKLIRFAWGQDRLPADDAEFERTATRLLVKPSNTFRGDPNRALPKADTCFFNIELPPYTSEAAMRERLHLAISSCSDIDADEPIETDTSRGF